MAWSQDIRDKVRNGYIFDQLPLDIVAMKYAVPHDTARRWKTPRLHILQRMAARQRKSASGKRCYIPKTRREMLRDFRL
ncbi:DUF1804 family protein [Escherichia coli]|uniref:DUF1804 family protein n=1 Tax=Escherichia coli TaxID=562 RepID=UPI002035C86B|nr:DUF1804 family protein [Escherichia coli]